MNIKFEEVEGTAGTGSATKPSAAPSQPETKATDTHKGDSAQDLIDKFKKGSADPKVVEAEAEITDALKKAEPLSDMHQKILNSGMIEKWLLKILIWGFTGLNVWIYNQIMRRGKTPIPKDAVEVSELDKEKMTMLTTKFAPQVMDFLRKIKGEFLVLGFMEWNIIEQIHDKAKEMDKLKPPKEKKKDDKKKAETESEKDETKAEDKGEGAESKLSKVLTDEEK